MKVKYVTTKTGIKIGCRYDRTINYNNRDQNWIRTLLRRWYD
jgi:hypothetical protein